MKPPLAILFVLFVHLSPAQDYFSISDSFFRLGMYDSAIHYINLDIKISESKNRTAYDYRIRGYYQAWAGQHHHAVISYYNAFDIFKEMDDPENAADALNRKGLSNEKMLAYGLAIQDYTQALELDLDPNSAIYAHLIYNRAKASTRIGKFIDRSVVDMNKAIAIYRAHDMADDIINCYIEFAYFYHKSGNNEKALEYNQAVEIIARENGLQDRLAESLNNQAVCLYYLSGEEKAMEYLQASGRIAQSDYVRQLNLLSYHEILGTKRGIQYLVEAQKFQTIGGYMNRKQLIEAYDELISYYKSIRQLDSVVLYQELKQQLRPILVIDSLEMVNAQQQAIRSQDAIDDQIREEKHRYVVIAAAGLVLGLVVLVIGLYLYARHVKRDAEKDADLLANFYQKEFARIKKHSEGMRKFLGK